MARRTTNTVDTVIMTKDGTETSVVRSAFEKVWKDKGWSLKEEGATTHQQATGTSARQPANQTDPTKNQTEGQPKG